MSVDQYITTRKTGRFFDVVLITKTADSPQIDRLQRFTNRTIAAHKARDLSAGTGIPALKAGGKL